MSIFKETLPRFVIDQLSLREAIIKQGNNVQPGEEGYTKSPRTGSPRVRLKGSGKKVTLPAGSFYTNTVSKQCTIRMSSGVDVKSSKEGGPFGEWITEPTGVELSKRWVLEGGIPLEKSTKIKVGEIKKKDSDGKEITEDVMGDVRLPRGGFSKRGGAYGDKSIRSSARDGFGIVPMPGIVDANIKTKSAYGSLRDAQVNFVCHNRDQLEVLELLYMRPGYPILLEWGWTPYIGNDGKRESYFPIMSEWWDKNSTLDNINERILLKKRDSGGNYDGFAGIIKNFEINARPDGGYNCSTSIIALGEVLEGLKGGTDEEDSLLYRNATADQKAPINSFLFYLHALRTIAHAGISIFSELGMDKRVAAIGKKIVADIIAPVPENDEYVEGEDQTDQPEKSISELLELNFSNQLQGADKELLATRVADLLFNKQGFTAEEIGERLNYFSSLTDLKALEPYIITNSENLIPNAALGQYGGEESSSNFVGVSWDLIAEIFNTYIAPQIKPPNSKNNKLILNENGENVNTKVEEPETLGSFTFYDGNTNKYLNYSKVAFPSGFKVNYQATDFQDGDVDLSESVVDSSKLLGTSLNKDVCLLPHQFQRKIDTNLSDSTIGVSEAIITDRSIGKIFINIDYLFDLYDRMYYDEEGFVKSFNFLGFFQQVWEKDITDATAGQHNFIVNVDPGRNTRYRIIDYDVQTLDVKVGSTKENPRFAGIRAKDVYEFKIQSNESIVREFNFNTSIPANMASIISIAAQAPDSVSSLESVSFAAFNKHIRSRFTVYTPPDKQKLQEEFEKEKKDLALALQRLEKHNIKMLQHNADSTASDNVLTGNVSVNSAKDIIKNLDTLIHRLTSRDISGEDPTYERINNPIPGKSAVIPLRFNMKMDGISGVVIGNVFKIDKTRLPIGYQGDDIAFIITAEHQEITSGQDWTTILTGQLMLLDLEKERVDIDQEEATSVDVEITLQETSAENQAFLNELNVTEGVIPLFEEFVKEVEIPTWPMTGEYEVIITSGFRTFEKQNQLNLDDSRNAKPGYSLHNYGLAIDLNLKNKATGELIRKADNVAKWEETGIVTLADRMGLKWGGDFTGYYDPVHFYLPEIVVAGESYWNQKSTKFNNNHHAHGYLFRNAVQFGDKSGTLSSEDLKGVSSNAFIIQPSDYAGSGGYEKLNKGELKGLWMSQEGRIVIKDEFKDLVNKVQGNQFDFTKAFNRKLLRKT